MAARDHPIRSLEIPEIEELELLSNQLQIALRRQSHQTISRLRESLREVSERIPFENIPNPLDNLDPVDSLSVNDLATSGGIYLFNSDSGQYVGLTENFRIRFHIPLYGHLTDRNNSRSRLVIESGEWGADWQVYYLESYTRNESRSDAVNINLSQDEIFWYYLLRNYPGFQLVNSEGNIGMTSETSGFPVISFCFETQRYAIYDSLGMFTRTTQAHTGNSQRHILRTATHNGHVRHVKTVPGVQPAMYYALRFATDNEASLLQEENLHYQDLLDAINLNPTDCALNQLDSGGGDRFARLVWNQGTFSSDVDARLRRYRRGAYNLNREPSQFEHGIFPDTGGSGWQIKARTGPGYMDQQGRRGFDDEIEAAIFRERWIVENNWQSFNTDDMGYPSNARQLNMILPEDEQLPVW